MYKRQGHDIMALERFDPEVKHMIVFDVLSYDSPVGDKGDVYKRQALHRALFR